MTIIVGVNSGSSVVLAADRFRSGPEAPNVPRFITKVLRHASQPLAVAMTGEALLMRPGSSEGEWVDDLISRGLSTIRLDEGWSAQAVAKGFAAALHPRLLDTEKRGGMPLGGGGTGLTLFVAAVCEGRGQFLRLRMRREVEIEVYEGARSVGQSMPDELQPGFFAQPSMAALYAAARNGTLNSHGAARYLSGAVHEAIAREASLHGGKNVAVGGGADVAIVDSHGARPWPDDDGKRRARNQRKSKSKGKR